jgi:hypothetical protein
VQAVIKVGLLMDIVMISTIMLIVYLTVEIAVDLMSTHCIALNVYALKEREEAMEELLHPQQLL